MSCKLPRLEGRWHWHRVKLEPGPKLEVFQQANFQRRISKLPPGCCRLLNNTPKTGLKGARKRAFKISDTTLHPISGHTPGREEPGEPGEDARDVRAAETADK